LQNCNRGTTLLALFLFLATANSVFALPRFAILEGEQCINCHINPTGGELRSPEEASDFMNSHLSFVQDHGGGFNFDPHLGEDILIGGDVRFQYLYDGQMKKTTFQSMEGAIYSAIHLYTSTRLYVKYDFVNSAYEAYGLYNFNQDNSYVKVGAFSPSYGIRLDDHTAYTRGGNFGLLQGIPLLGLIFSPDYRDLGVELGSKFGRLFVTADLTNGNGLANYDFNSRKALIGRAEYMTHGFLNLVIGASGYFSGGTKMWGAHAGIGIGKRLSILGEFDWARSLPTVLPVNSLSNASFVELSYYFARGLFGVARFDYFKQYPGGPTYYRYILGADVYPIPHIDLIPQVRFNTTNVVGAPQPVEALIQSHVYF
jgi:hypothetical protein